MTRARQMIVDCERRGVWEIAKEEPRESKSKRVDKAVEEFLADLGSRKGKNRQNPTLSKYRTLLGRLAAWAEKHGYVGMDELTFEVLVRFRDSWPYQSVNSTRNAITRLRKFWKFAVKMKWAGENIAAELERPDEEPIERLPFSPDEEKRIYAAARSMKVNGQCPVKNREQETFCYLMRYSGMAIADASLLERAEVKGDEIRYYREKLKKNVRRVFVVVPIPAWLVDRLKELPLHQERYYFCHGSDYLKSSVDVWRRRLNRIFKEAKVKDATSHRFRHTFATSLLEAGESLEDVSRWLGHASIKTTEKHYSHWIESRIKKSSDKLRKRYAEINEREPS